MHNFRRRSTLTRRAINILRDIHEGGLSASEVSGKYGVSQRTVEAILNGENVPAVRAHNQLGYALPDESFRQFALREKWYRSMRSSIEASDNGTQRLAAARERERAAE